MEKAILESKETFEIPTYLLRAYALFFTKYGVTKEFSQKELDWIVSESMKKKIFALLLKAGWIAKKQKNTYNCLNPELIFKRMVKFKVQELIKKAEKEYCFTGLSSIEIWSDYSYIQRSFEKSPYFIKVLKKDLTYWKRFFNNNEIPNYILSGSTIGEFVILIPVTSFSYQEQNGFKVEPLKETIKYAKSNDIYNYASEYIKNKYNNIF